MSASRRTTAAITAVAAVTALTLPMTAAAAETVTSVTPVVTPSVAAEAVRATAADPSGTLVFLKKHNVWIARGDGSDARAVTHNGTAHKPYRSPSESDTGIIAAARGARIVRMNQRGTVLTTINPPGVTNSVGETMDGTVNEVAISPNGKTIAFSYIRYSCPIAADCMIRYGTGYTKATKRKALGRPTFYRDPSFVTNTRTLQTGGFLSQVMLQDRNAAAKHWFDDHDYASADTDLADGELSPDGTMLAEVRGYRETSSIFWYQVSGNAKTGAPPAVPQPLCATNGEPEHASPTWSPDSTTLAWAGASGIWVKGDATTCDVQPQLLIKGGSSPDWSKAALR